MIYWFLLDCPQAGIDDANIYFTYAKNLSEGHGLIYNIGGERVEGFTSLVWMWICSIAYGIDATSFTWFLLGGNILVISGVLYFSILLLQQWSKSKDFWSSQAFFFAVLFVLLPGYIDWTILSLMETGLWSLALFLIYYSLHVYIAKDLHASVWIILLVPLTICIRPEAIAWWIAIALLIFVMERTGQRSFAAAIKLPLLVAGIAIISTATLVGWRLSYFGFPFPNTYYAKVSSDVWYNLKEGIEYLIWFFIGIPASTLVVVLLPATAWRIWDRARKNRATLIELRQLVSGGFIVIGLGIPLLTGGDHFLLSRFYQPLLPIMLLFIFYQPFWQQLVDVPLLSNRPSHQLPYLRLAVVFIFVFATTHLPEYIAGIHKHSIKKEFDYVQEGYMLAENLEQFFSEIDHLPIAAKQAVGGFGFAYDGKVLDVYGLNHVKMAHADKAKYGSKNHASFNKRVFFEEAPDIFQFKFSDRDPRSNKKGGKDTLDGLLKSAKFIGQYPFVSIKHKGFRSHLYTYASQEFLAKLAHNGIYQVDYL